LKDADIIHVVDEGRLVESGTWATLLDNQGGRFRSLARAQGIA
jgi:ABC-type multidrug transport system fused ATPase/permease subunit